MLQPPQSVFPACICAAVLPIVHLMEDGEVREDGVAGRIKSVMYNECIYLSIGLCCSYEVLMFDLGGKSIC